MSSSAETQRFARLRALFDRIAELDPVPREAVIHSTCGDDAEMERELRALLEAHDREHGRTGETRVRLLEDSTQALASGAETGERVGPFVLREVLGRGGMGVVYRAERADGAVQQQVAVKVLQRMHLDEAGIRRFAQERDIVAQLAHPGIARLFDAGTTRDGYPYYAMELIDGQPITAWCDARKLSVPDRLELFLKVCDAVRFAHANLVLHRDIKPANVLVDANGTAKLIDFGIAKPITATDDTATGLQLFSPSNAAPEQLRGERCGVACDVYQLGTLLYEMLTGTTVLGDTTRSPAEIEVAILHRVPARPSEVARDQSTAKLLRGDLDTIVLRALRKEPERRYGSVEQLGDEIRRHLRDEPIVARGGERAYRLRKFVQRRRVALAATGVVVLLVVAFVATILMQSQQVERERDSARAVSLFLTGVFAEADPAKSLGRDVPIGQVLDRGRLRLGRELGAQPEVRGPLLGVLAEVYTILNDVETAVALLDEAEREVARATSIDHRTRAEFLVRATLVRRAQGDFEAAMAAARAALAIQERLGDSAGEQWKARSALFSVMFQRQDPASWKQPLADALRALEADPDIDPIELAKARKAIGHSLTFAGDLEGAEHLQRLAYDTLQRALPPDDPEIISSEYALGVLLTRQGEATEAVRFLSRSLDGHRALYGPQTTAAARTQGRLAQAQLASGDSEAALTSALHALETWKSLKSGKPGDAMVLEHTVGEMYRQTGRFAEAESHYREAVRIQDELSGVLGANSIDFRTGLALALAARGQHDEAARLLAQCEPAVTYENITHARWAIAYAESLAALGRREDAMRYADRADAIVSTNRQQAGDLVSRVDALRRR